jgi:hypothetical protein
MEVVRGRINFRTRQRSREVFMPFWLQETVACIGLLIFFASMAVVL